MKGVHTISILTVSLLVTGCGAAPGSPIREDRSTEIERLARGIGLPPHELVSYVSDDYESYETVLGARFLFFADQSVLFRIGRETDTAVQLLFPMHDAKGEPYSEWSGLIHGISLGMTKSETRSILGDPSWEASRAWGYHDRRVLTRSDDHAYLTLMFSAKDFVKHFEYRFFDAEKEDDLIEFLKESNPEELKRNLIDEIVRGLLLEELPDE